MICDPLLSEYGPTRPPVLISKEFRKRGYEINLFSMVANEDVKRKLESHGIRVNPLRRRPPLLKTESLTWFYFWLMEGFFSANSRKLRRLKLKLDETVINFSNTIIFPSQIWYAQGPPTVLIDNIKDSLAAYYRATYFVLSRTLRKKDQEMTRKFCNLSERVVVNSRHLAGLYARWKVKVKSVIYPPIDCQTFKPATNAPTEDYALTYFGKETDFRVIQKALDGGIRIKAFGGKIRTAPKKTLKHPNLEFLGRISDSQLIEHYSNALFTFFPFIDEPFGYVPVESMACGTPVVTFSKQGPRETVVNKVTGWLADNENEIVDVALRIWKEGYPKSMRDNCRKRSLIFDTSSIVRQWLEEIDAAK
jgi:glycosyltransferase involved in cell wall biosynthesis